MRILHVIADVHKGGGGTSEVVPRLARALHALGHEVAVAAVKSEISDEMQIAIDAGVRYEGSAEISGPFPRALGYAPDFAHRITPLVKAADVVHLHGLWMYPTWAAAWLARKYRKPYVMMPHGFLEPERLKISKWKKKLVGLLVERRNLNRSSGLVATAASEAEGFRAYGLDRPTHVMPIGLDFDSIDSAQRNEELLQRIGCDSGKKRVLYFSRITPIKGLDLLCEAWDKVKRADWQLVIVGPDDRGYTDEMKALYASHIADGSVVFHGPIYGRDKFDLLKSVDAFVLPTRSENWSIAVAEAMAAGLPVVCTKGAPWRCISEVGAGAWVDVSVEGIAGGLSEVMNASDDVRIAMGRRGRAWVEDNLQWSKIAREMIEFYEKLKG